MRKLKMHVHLSLDGYASAPDGSFDWIAYNDQLATKAQALTQSADTVIFGRKTYKGMQSYWPTVLSNPHAPSSELKHAAWLASATKIVVSTTLTPAEADWEKSLLLGENFADEIKRLKAEPGGDMVSFGSPTLVASCVRLGLVDELHIFLNPIILGGGQPLFSPQDRQSLTLTECDAPPGGVVALCYTPRQ